ncbi:MAG TPA: DUF1326 domain-containing protein [Thermoanaerobaculia bacterium]|nr:DUF1326 domain-containing protein [Thermoanaerobaculia bacterium]
MRKHARCLFTALLALCVALPAAAAPTVTGDYVEARTSDVWTGPCFANGEVNLVGQEAILAWRVKAGSWQGVPLDGLSVAAVVTASATLGDPYADPLPARSLLLVDAAADAAQRRALADFAREMAGELLSDVVSVEAAPISFAVDGDAVRLTAGDVAELRTRALNHHDRHCGNEILYYPPLIEGVVGARAAATVVHAYRGGELGRTWSSPGKRSVYVGTFSR